MTTAEHPDTTGWAEINVATPLPLAVAGTLMELIGTAWPDAVVKTNGPRFNTFGNDRALTMLVNHRRRPKKVSKKAAQAIVGAQADEQDEAAAAGVGDTEFLGFDDGWVKFSPPEELCKYLGSIAHDIMKANAEAVNYLEWEVHVQPEGEPRQDYVLCIGRSKEQTAHNMRLRAEQGKARVEAELDTLRARLADIADRWEGADPDAPNHDLYNEVRALVK